jgi:hypothetical protein
MRSARLAAFASLLAAPRSKRREAFRGDNWPSPHASTLDQRRRTARSARVRHPLPDLDATAPRGWVDQTPGGASGLGFVARLIVLVLAVCCFATVPNAHGFSSFEWLTLSVLRYTRISETRFTQEIVHLNHDGTFDVVSSDEIAIARVSWPEESLANLDLVSGRFMLPELAWNIYASGADISRFVQSDATYALEGGTLYVIVCARGACDPNDLPRLRGSLQVTLQPAQALAAGAGGRSEGTTPWRNSGETESSIPVGPHTVEFKNLSGWQTPAQQSVQIQAGQTAALTAAYTPLQAADDHGNSLATATPVTPGSATTGAIETAGDNDYFRVDVPQAGRLMVYTTGSTDTYGYLLDSSGNELERNDDGNDRSGTATSRFSSRQTVAIQNLLLRNILAPKLLEHP